MGKKDFKSLIEALRFSANTDRGIRFLSGTQGEEYLSYGGLWEMAIHTLAKLQKVGIRVGDEVVVLSETSKQFVVFYWACILGGIIPVPLVFPHTQAELSKIFYVLRVLKSPWIATDNDSLSGRLEKYASANNHEDMFAYILNRIQYPQTSDTYKREPVLFDANPKDIAFIQFSSGTTGKPKGVIVTHENLLYNAYDLFEVVDLNDNDSFLSWKPITHDFGMIAFHLSPVVAGANQFLITTNTFIWNPMFWLSAVNKYRATILGSPNFGLRFFLNRFNPDIAQSEDWDLSCVKFLMNGAEPISGQLCREFGNMLEQWGWGENVIKAGYGLAEGTLIVSLCTIDEHLQIYKIDRTQMTSGSKVKYVEDGYPESLDLVDCGGSCRHSAIRITDEERKDLGENRIGNIEIKGKCVTSGYYQNKEATDSVLSPDKWLATQDIGFMHQGRLVVIGRAKEMIIIGGINYFPHDIESAILRNLGKEKLNQYIACGVPNPQTGTEDLIIFVYFKKSDADFLPNISQIKQIVFSEIRLSVAHILPIKQIPKTTSGKVARVSLAQDFLNGRFDKSIAFFKKSMVESSKEKEQEFAIYDTNELIHLLEEKLKEMLMISEIDINKTFFELGLTSIQLIQLQEYVESHLNIECSSSIFINYPNIKDLAKKIASHPSKTKNQTVVSKKDSEEDNSIAVVGMSCRFPGGTDSPERFWDLLKNGIDPVEEIPHNRWYKDPNLNGNIITREGGFLEDIDQFDPMFFNISYKEAERLDPQHRILMELVWEAFEDAGWNPRSLSWSNTGVFVGISSHDYLQVGYNLSNDINSYSLTGTLPNSASGRISYTFGLKGPSMAIDTACSSSLVCIHQAVTQLMAGHCDIALAAGVNLILRAEAHVSFTQLGALSASGRCRSFDEAADGYIRSEGGAVIVLKRLADAKRDRDHIWGVIKGTAVNHNGHGGGFTVPNGISQQKLIQDALIRSGLNIDDIDYIEAHGSGTKLGDPLEISALNEVFKDRARPLYIGCVKSNIGHTEAAAGLAGICKVLLAMHNAQIPPNLHLENKNSLVEWEDMLFKVVDKTVDWHIGDRTRRAGISSFGLSGTNAHVIIEEFKEDENLKSNEKTPIPSKTQLFAISAKTEQLLRDLMQGISKWCNHPTAELDELCRTLSLSRAPFRYRVAFTVESIGDLKKKLDARLERTEGVGADAIKESDRLVFLFTGQGSQYSNMACELYSYACEFKDKLDEIDKMFYQYGEISILDAIFGSEKSALDMPLLAQPAIFSVEVALAHYWKSLGVAPKIVIGHSIGEYAAAHVAGVLTLSDAVQMVLARAKVMDKVPRIGSMVSLLCDIDTAEAMVGEYSDVSIAGINAPENITVSGGAENVGKLKSKARKARIFVEDLNVSHPFHSVLMKESSKELEASIKKIKYNAPAIDWISTLKGDIIAKNEILNASYWGAHLVEPVQFMKCIHMAYDSGARLFLEIGTTATLSGLGAQNLNEDAVFLPSIRKNQSSLSHMQCAVGGLWETGYDVDWKAFYQGSTGRRIENLPRALYDKQRVWFKDLTGQRGESVINHQIEYEVPHMKKDTNDFIYIIREDLRQIIAQVTGAPIEKLEDSLHLFSLGLDSLMMVQIGKHIAHKFGVDIPIKSFFSELHTIELLADYVESKMPREQKHVEEPTTNNQIINQSTETDSDIKAVINRQLDVMERQLQLMGGYVQADPNVRKEVIQTKKEKQKDVTNYSSDINMLNETLTMAQDQFIKALVKKRTMRTKKSKQFAEKYRQGLADWIVSLNFTPSTKEMIYPLVSEWSKGSKFMDIDGNEYIDTAMGYGVEFFGHKPEFIVQAIQEQLNKGFELGPQMKLVGEISNLICELTNVERVAFCNSGTEAVMVALRLARAVTGRNKIAKFITSFHGSFDGVLAEASEGEAVPMTIGIPQSMVDDTIVLTYGSQSSLDQIRKNGADLAAVLVEPVQSRNPDLQPREYLHELRKICTELDIALVFDEMVTGFRIELGGAQAYFGVPADIVLYGKLIGGGMPIGIVAGKAKYLNAVDGGVWSYEDSSRPVTPTTFFAGTFCKHPLTMAATKAALEYLKIKGKKEIADLNDLTKDFVGKANHYFKKAKLPLKAIHFGSMYRLQPMASTDISMLSLELKLFFQLMLEAGVYVWERRTCFFSLAHTKEDADKILDALIYSTETLREGGFTFKVLEPSDPTSGKHENKDIPKYKINSGSTCLSLEERRIYILSSLKGGNEAYHICGMLKLDGKPDMDKIRQSIDVLMDRHEMLRCSYCVNGKNILSEIGQKVKPEFLQMDLRSVYSEEDFHRELTKPFKLAKAPLWRYGILIDKDGVYNLFFNFHHIIADGRSMDIILSEMESIVEGRPLHEQTLSYREYVKIQEEFLKSNEAAKQREWWISQLEPQPPALDLQSDAPRKALNEFEGDIQYFTIEEDLLLQIKAIAKENQATLFMVLLSAWSCFLSKISEQTDFCVGVPWDNRNLGDFDQTVGMFAQTLVLRMQPKKTLDFIHFLEDVKETCLGAYSNPNYPLDALLEALHTPRDLGRNPLFDVMFIYEDGQKRKIKLGSVSGEETELPLQSAAFDATMTMTERNGKLYCSLNYSSVLFSGQRIASWIKRFQILLKNILRNPHSELGDYKILEPEEEAKLLAMGTGITYDGKLLTVGEILAKVFESYADQPALYFEDNEITFGELNNRVNIFSQHLKAKGMVRGNVIAVLLPRSPDIIVAMLAVQRIGCTWMPLDLSLPKERLCYMLETSGAKMVCCHKSLYEQYELELPLSDPEDMTEQDSNEVIDVMGNESDSAYIIFTSGSTGKPKGVQVNQRALANFLIGMPKALKWQPGMRIACLTTATFDIFILETLVSLSQGGCIVLATDGKTSMPEDIAHLVQQGNVDYLQMTPSRLRLLCTNKEALDSVLSSIRSIFVGGEAFPEDLLPLLQSYENMNIFNVYGPTETCVWSTYKDLTKEDHVDIGLPIMNTYTYVLNRNKQLIQEGEEGDLWIGGKGVADGYVGADELTAKHFTENPFHDGRMYMTGDKAKWSNGNLQCLGRNDDQVKLRGYRIELGEIERLIQEYDEIIKAVVRIEEIKPGNKVLIAYYKRGNKETEISENELRTYLAHKLPDYMVPHFMMELQEFPLMHNGKLDRKSLPRFADAKIDQPKKNTENESIHEIEAALLEVWKNVLGHSNIGLNDNFFDVGGNSFSLVQAHAEIEELFPDTVVTADLFANPTISSMRKYIESRKTSHPICTVKLSQDWLVEPSKQEGVLKTDLSKDLKIKLYELGKQFHMNISETVMTLFALYLSKSLPEQQIAIGLIKDSNRIRPIGFDFENWIDIGQLMCGVSIELTKEDKDLQIQTFGFVPVHKDMVKIGFSISKVIDKHKLLQYFDFMIIAEEYEESVSLTLPYSARMDRKALNNQFMRFRNFIDYIVNKANVLMPK